MIACVVSDEISKNFSCANFGSLFQGGDLCGIDANTISPHVCLCGPRQISKFVGSNQYDFMVPVFQRGDLCGIDGKMTSLRSCLCGPRRVVFFFC